MRLVLNIHKYSRSLPLTTRNLKIYIVVLPRSSHIFSPDDLNNTLLFQDRFETAAGMGIVGETYIPRTGEGEGASENTGPAHWSASGLILSMTNSNTNLQPMVLVCP